MKRSDFYFIIVMATLLTVIILWQFGNLSTNKETQQIANQTLIQLHEDKARENQTAIQQKFEEEGREKQTKINKALLMEMKQELKSYIINQNQTTQKELQYQREALENQEIMIKQIKSAMQQNDNITKDIFRISQEHKQVAKDHDSISTDIQNVTNNTDKSLYRYGENSVTKLDELVQTQKKLLTKLDTILLKLNQTK